MQLESVRTPSRVDHVFEQLRSQIVSGAIAAGQSAAERARSRGGARRQPPGRARGDPKRLEFLELVEVRHGQGSFVQDLSASSALQVVEALLRDPAIVTLALLDQLLVFRRHITLSVVELAARNRSGEQLDRARSLLERGGLGGRRPEARARDRPRVERAARRSHRQPDVPARDEPVHAPRRAPRPALLQRGTRPRALHGRTTARCSRRSRRAIPTAACRLVDEMLRYSEERIRSEAHRLEEAGQIGPPPAADAVTIARESLRWNGWGRLGESVQMTRSREAARCSPNWADASAGTLDARRRAGRDRRHPAASAEARAGAARAAARGVRRGRRVDESAHERVTHAVGRSLPDLLRLRRGELERVPEAVVAPADEGAVAARAADRRRRRSSRSFPSAEARASWAGWSHACGPGQAGALVARHHAPRSLRAPRSGEPHGHLPGRHRRPGARSRPRGARLHARPLPAVLRALDARRLDRDAFRRAAVERLRGDRRVCSSACAW